MPRHVIYRITALKRRHTNRPQHSEDWDIFSESVTDTDSSTVLPWVIYLSRHVAHTQTHTYADRWAGMETTTHSDGARLCNGQSKKNKSSSSFSGCTSFTIISGLKISWRLLWAEESSGHTHTQTHTQCVVYMLSWGRGEVSVENSLQNLHSTRRTWRFMLANTDVCRAANNTKNFTFICDIFYRYRY